MEVWDHNDGTRPGLQPTIERWPEASDTATLFARSPNRLAGGRDVVRPEFEASRPGTTPEYGVLDRRTFVRVAGGQLALVAVFGCSDKLLADRQPPPEGGPSSPSLRFVVDDPDFVYSRPCFSPDGQRILFMRAPLTGDRSVIENSNESDWGLWTVPESGGVPERFFYDPRLHATRPDWSWSTGQVAFTGVRDSSSTLWILNQDGGDLTSVPVGQPTLQQVHYPSWYPDGRAIALTDYGGRQVVRVQLGEPTTRPLTDPRVIWAGMCSVSPDSRSGNPIAFAGQRPSDRYDAGENEIWVQDRTGLKPLDGRQGRMPAWSPTGRLAFVSHERRRPMPTFTLYPRSVPAQQSTVYVADAVGRDGQTPAFAASPFGFGVGHAKWSPDGTKLVCMAWSLRTARRGIAIIGPIP